VEPAFREAPASRITDWPCEATTNSCFTDECVRNKLDACLFEGANLFKSETVNLLGTTLQVKRAGKGSPILFLHGATHVAQGSEFFESLCAQHEVIVPDHPGYGQSGDPKFVKDIGDVAYLYLDLLDKLGLRGAHAVGESIGGWIAAELSIRDPRAFGSISLLSPAGVRMRGVEMGDIFIWSPEELRANLFFSPPPMRQAPTPEELELQLRDKYMTAKLAWHPRLYSPSLQQWLHRITAPVQIVWGKQDKVLPVGLAQAWTSELPHARLHLLENCGHLPRVELPAETAMKINSFLKAEK